MIAGIKNQPLTIPSQLLRNALFSFWEKERKQSNSFFVFIPLIKKYTKSRIYTDFIWSKKQMNMDFIGCDVPYKFSMQWYLRNCFLWEVKSENISRLIFFQFLTVLSIVPFKFVLLFLTNCNVADIFCTLLRVVRNTKNIYFLNRWKKSFLAFEVSILKVQRNVKK